MDRISSFITSGRPDIKIEDRSYGLLTLFPQPPIFDWLARLDAETESATTGQASRPVVLDLSSTMLHVPGIRALVAELETRELRVVGLTGLQPTQIGEHIGRIPPILPGVPLARPADNSADPVAAGPSLKEPANLVVEDNVRSGQQVRCSNGDVTVVGSVSSGAEIIASGSIHIYGTLRGRAIAGVSGGPAQIFCRRLEAELLAINGISLTADDMDASLRGRAIRAWIDRDVIRLRSLE
jgi:septum site-determining protein MinC